jgi:hypothetical protein
MAESIGTATRMAMTEETAEAIGATMGTMNGAGTMTEETAEAIGATMGTMNGAGMMTEETAEAIGATMGTMNGASTMTEETAEAIGATITEEILTAASGETKAMGIGMDGIAIIIIIIITTTIIMAGSVVTAMRVAGGIITITAGVRREIVTMVTSVAVPRASGSITRDRRAPNIREISSPEVRLIISRRC